MYCQIENLNIFPHDIHILNILYLLNSANVHIPIMIMINKYYSKNKVRDLINLEKYIQRLFNYIIL